MGATWSLSQSWLRTLAIAGSLVIALFTLLSAESQAVLWTSAVNVSVVNGSLQKTSGCDGCDDAGAISQQALIEGDPESERSEKYQQHAAHPLTGPLDEHWYLPPKEDDERGPCQQEQRVPEGKAHRDAHRMRARSGASRRPH